LKIYKGFFFLKHNIEAIVCLKKLIIWMNIVFLLLIIAIMIYAKLKKDKGTVKL